MNKLELLEKLIKVVPEIQPQYLAELEWWGEDKPGTHIIFGDILNSYLIILLELDYEHEILARIFGFLEELANSDDLNIKEIVAFTICERLGGDPDILLKARKYMGKATLLLSHEIEKFWNSMYRIDE